MALRGALATVVTAVMAAAPASAAEQPADRYALANACWVVASEASGAYVATAAGGYRAAARTADAATRFFAKPTGLGTYLLQDRDRRLLAVDDPVAETALRAAALLEDAAATGIGAADALTLVDGLAPAEEASDAAVGPAAAALRELSGVPAVGRAAAPGELAEWEVDAAGDGAFALRSTANGRYLTVASDGALALAATPARFRLERSGGCAPFPEAEVGARGAPPRGANPDGTVWGWADVHTHVTAFQRLGGSVISGAPFHRFGVAHALGHDDHDHGPHGAGDVVGNMLRDGIPAGTHDTTGWPSFPEWPSWDGFTHQQSYYRWLERAWMSGQRVMVSLVLGDEVLCQLVPRKERDCNETADMKRQIRTMFELQDYVDAQAGGPGKGFMRIVRSPREARRAIEDGKLAVVLGTESSKLFDCGEYQGEPECTRADVDRGIAEFHALGVRTVFPAHWVDNAFAGAGLFDQSELLLNLLNKLETGHWFRTEPCPAPGMGAHLQALGVHFPGRDPLSRALNEAQFAAVPTYPPGPHCNAKGLTPLGEYLIERLIAHGMMIETDHLSAKARTQVLEIAERHGHPVISGHFHAGGVTSDEQFRRIYAVGGLAAPANHQPSELPAHVRRLTGLRDGDFYFGVPLSSDTGGLAAQPAPLDATGERPLAYPFRSRDGGVEFERQRTGERVFDINRDGVAHYGLYADWIAAAAAQDGGAGALDQVFRSAEAYLRMWERADRNARRDPLHSRAARSTDAGARVPALRRRGARSPSPRSRGRSARPRPSRCTRSRGSCRSGDRRAS